MQLTSTNKYHLVSGTWIHFIVVWFLNQMIYISLLNFSGNHLHLLISVVVRFDCLNVNMQWTNEKAGLLFYYTIAIGKLHEDRRTILLVAEGSVVHLKSCCVYFQYFWLLFCGHTWALKMSWIPNSSSTTFIWTMFKIPVLNYTCILEHVITH